MWCVDCPGGLEVLGPRSWEVRGTSGTLELRQGTPGTLGTRQELMELLNIVQLDSTYK